MVEGSQVQLWGNHEAVGANFSYHKAPVELNEAEITERLS